MVCRRRNSVPFRNTRTRRFLPQDESSRQGLPSWVCNQYPFTYLRVASETPHRRISDHRVPFSWWILSRLLIRIQDQRPPIYFRGNQLLGMRSVCCKPLPWGHWAPQSSVLFALIFRCMSASYKASFSAEVFAHFYVKDQVALDLMIPRWDTFLSFSQTSKAGRTFFMSLRIASHQ